MEEFKALSRPTQFALLSSAAAGIVGFILVIFFIDMLHWIFIPSVMVMVFISAYFAFKRQTQGKTELTYQRIFWIAFEVGTRTHFYTFALYFLLYYFFVEFTAFNLEIIGAWIIGTLMMGISSLVMFIWVAIPMYIGVGYLQKSMEKNLNISDQSTDDSIPDDSLEIPKTENEGKLDTI